MELIDIRRVRRRSPEPDGGISWVDTYQLRPPTFTVGPDGLQFGPFGPWRTLDTIGSVVYVNEAGEEIPAP